MHCETALWTPWPLLTRTAHSNTAEQPFNHVVLSVHDTICIFVGRLQRLRSDWHVGSVQDESAVMITLHVLILRMWGRVWWPVKHGVCECHTAVTHTQSNHVERQDVFTQHTSLVSQICLNRSVIERLRSNGHDWNFKRDGLYGQMKLKNELFWLQTLKMCKIKYSAGSLMLWASFSAEVMDILFRYTWHHGFDQIYCKLSLKRIMCL